MLDELNHKIDRASMLPGHIFKIRPIKSQHVWFRTPWPQDCTPPPQSL